MDLKTTDEKIRSYQELLAQNPDDPSVKNNLASEYLKKNRETGAAQFLDAAEKLVDSALNQSPDNYEVILTMASIRMNQHDFSAAAELAERAIKLDPDSAAAYALRGDAAYEIGDYEECKKAYDEMSSRRPGPAAYARQAFYSRLIGKSEDAFYSMQAGLRLSDPVDTETISWFLIQLGNLSFNSGKVEDAQIYFNHALKTLPSSYQAMAGQARVEAAKGNYDQAVKLYRDAIAIVPMPEFLAPLGDLYKTLGKTSEANKQYELIEYIALLEEKNGQIHNRQLAMYYADHNLKREKAVELAHNELKIRKDIYGYDAYAWCLFKAGKIQEANRIIPLALKMGTRDPMLYYHAGEIFMKAGKQEEGRKFLRTALEINPYFHLEYSKRAQEYLQQIGAER